MGADPETTPADPGLAFARIARAVRQTVALEARLDEDAQGRDNRVAAERAAHEARLAQAVRRQGSSRKLRAALMVEQVIEKLGDPEEEGSEAERLGNDLCEWLADDREDEAFADRPIGELVMEICRTLGVTPDWSLWQEEDWAVEMAAREAASPPVFHDAPAIITAAHHPPPHGGGRAVTYFGDTILNAPDDPPAPPASQKRIRYSVPEIAAPALNHIAHRDRSPAPSPLEGAGKAR